MTDQLKLALREEGDRWNAYIAADDAPQAEWVWIGALWGGFVEDDVIREAFIDAMKKVVERCVEKAVNEKVSFWSKPKRVHDA